MKLRHLLSCSCMTASLLVSGTTLQATAQESDGDGAPQAIAAAKTELNSVEFESPIRLTASDSPIKVEAPGYACPSFADIDGDGIKDLLVGQFSGGKIQVFKNLGKQGFAKGEWLQADGGVAEIPGVW